MFRKAQQEQIDRMLVAGRTFDHVAKQIGGTATWYDIQQHAWATGNMSWRGSMKMITSRLRKLETATTVTERKRLAQEIGDRARYLYYCAKAMRGKLEQIERVMS